MADIASVVYHLFNKDPRDAIDYMLNNFDKIKNYDACPGVGTVNNESEESCDSVTPAAPYDPYTCELCGCDGMVHHEAKADMLCLRCGFCYTYLSNQGDKVLDYQDEVNVRRDMFFGAGRKSEYKRLHHYSDVLNQIQGRKQTEVPPEVVDQVRQNLPQDLKKLTAGAVRKVLKQVGIGYKQYENAQAIVDIITKNKAMVKIPHGVEYEMKTHFMMVENAWNRVAGSKASARKSFLSYTYVIKQILVVLGHPDLSDAIETMKSKHRIKAHDAAWANICEKLGWIFHPLYQQNRVKKPRTYKKRGVVCAL